MSYYMDINALKRSPARKSKVIDKFIVILLLSLVFYLIINNNLHKTYGKTNRYLDPV